MRMAVAAALCGAAGAVQAGPTDAQLSALPTGPGERLRIEAGYDLANKDIDFLHLRQTSTNPAAGSVGDYHGGHVAASWQLADRWSVDASFWQRQIDYRSFTADVTTWHLAGQWRFIDGGPDRPSFALRLNVWGNQADELKRMTSVRVEGIRFTSATVTSPRDRQLQLDLLGGLPLSSRLSVTGQASVMRSEVDFDTVSAVARISGCSYDVQFTATRVIATCTENGDYTRISAPKSNYGIDVDQEARYGSWMAHVGGALRWKSEHWRMGAAYRYTAIRREHVDAVVERRGGTAYRSNHIATVDIGYRLWRDIVPFARGQVMTNQFNGEVPMSYNTLTANRFDKRYGLLTLGVLASF